MAANSGQSMAFSFPGSSSVGMAAVTQNNSLQWPALGKTDALGKVKIWAISYANGIMHSYHGRVDGKRVHVDKEVVLNKSGRSLLEQALVETRSAWRKKFQEGYRLLTEFGYEEDSEYSVEVAEDVSKIVEEMNKLQLRNVNAANVTNEVTVEAKSVNTVNSAVINPTQVVATPLNLPVSRDLFEAMLAQPYDSAKKLKWPLWAQEKLDGARMTSVLTVGQNGMTLQCRSRKTGTFSHLNHIKAQAELLLQFLPPDTVLDGELYSLDMDFRELIKRVRQQSQPHPDEIAVKYFLFDAFFPHSPEMPTEGRHELLSQAMAVYRTVLASQGDKNGSKVDHLRLVGLELVHNHEEVLAAHSRFVQKGSEGVILRHVGSVDAKKSCYRNGRSVNLLKYKDFVDEEGEIIGCEQGTGTEQGLVLWRVRDPRGYEMIVRPRGSFEERAELYQHWREYVGKMLTYRYQPSKDYDKPRFPVGIAIRDYEPEGNGNSGKVVRDED